MLVIPFAREHAVDHMVDEAVAQPDIVAQDAFLGEAEAFGDGATAQVVGGYLYLNAVQPQFSEGVIYHRAAGSGHQAFALHRSGQPVANFCLTILMVNKVKADHPHQFVLIENACVKTILLCLPRLRMADKGSHLLDGGGGIDPSHPAVQVFAVLINQRIQFVRVLYLKRAQFGLVIDGNSYRWNNHNSYRPLLVFFMVNYSILYTLRRGWVASHLPIKQSGQPPLAAGLTADEQASRPRIILDCQSSMETTRVVREYGGRVCV